MLIPIDLRSDDMRKLDLKILNAVSGGGGKGSDHGKDYGHDKGGKGKGKDKS